jgi:hypothetical protein
MTRTLSQEVATLDNDYLLLVAEAQPFQLLYWHYLHQQSWTVRTYPDHKEIPPTYGKLASGLWHSHSLLDLELSGQVTRHPEKESYYQIGNERRILVLYPHSTVLKEVNAMYESWRTSNALQK